MPRYGHSKIRGMPKTAKFEMPITSPLGVLEQNRCDRGVMNEPFGKVGSKKFFWRSSSGEVCSVKFIWRYHS